MSSPSALIILLSGAALALAASAEPHPKGFGQVCKNDACASVYSINQSLHTATARVDSRLRLNTAPRPAAAPEPDIELDYHYSRPGGNGKTHPLDNGSALHSGDEFTIRINAGSTRWVYLFHFDSAGQLNELLSLSGQGNQIQAGERRLLPGPARHFALDQHPGTETIHTIVADRPLPGLMARYRDGLANRATFAAMQSKGILIADDRPQSNGAGRLLACPKEPGYCREEFRIRHL